MADEVEKYIPALLADVRTKDADPGLALWGSKSLQRSQPTALEKVAVRRIASMIKTELSELACDFYEANGPFTREDVTRMVKSFLDPVRDVGGLADYRVGDVRVVTWEDLYPAMPVRLAVIAAYEAGELPSSCESPPDHPLAGLYRDASFYRLYGVDEDGAPWTDYYGDCEGPVAEGQWLEFVKWWKLPTPGNIEVNVYVHPTKPVESIQFKFIVPGVDGFAESVAEQSGGATKGPLSEGDDGVGRI